MKKTKLRHVKVGKLSPILPNTDITTIGFKLYRD
jgi:hypothetical protein